MQFDFEATVSETLACMSEITIDLDSGSCSLRKVTSEPRCEFPVVPDRLAGAPLSFLLECSLLQCARWWAEGTHQSSKLRLR